MIAHTLEPRVGDPVVVFDANAADSGYIKTRFQGHDIAGQERLRSVTDNVRCFRMRQSEAVSRMMGKVPGNARDRIRR